MRQHHSCLECCRAVYWYLTPKPELTSTFLVHNDFKISYVNKWIFSDRHVHQGYLTGLGSGPDISEAYQWSIMCLVYCGNMAMARETNSAYTKNITSRNSYPVKPLCISEIITKLESLFETTQTLFIISIYINSLRTFLRPPLRLLELRYGILINKLDP